MLRCSVCRFSGHGRGEHSTSASGPHQRDDRRPHVPEGDQGSDDRRGSLCDGPGGNILRLIGVHQLQAGIRRQERTAEEKRGNVSRQNNGREGYRPRLETDSQRRRETRKGVRDVFVA